MVLPNFFVPFFLFFILQGLLEQLELPFGHLHQLQEQPSEHLLLHPC
jgi:hypothetical protein